MPPSVPPDPGPDEVRAIMAELARLCDQQPELALPFQLTAPRARSSARDCQPGLFPPQVVAGFRLGF